MSFCFLLLHFTFAFMSLVRFSKDSTFQRIKGSFLDDNAVVLTPKEQEKKARMMQVWGLRINNKYSTHQAIQIIIRDHNISQATAYREYNMAMEIFGNLDASNVAAERLILKESLWNAYQKAVKAGNLELEIKALKEYKDLARLDADENAIDPDKLQAHEYHIRVNRRAYKILDIMMERGGFDFNNIDVDDIDYQEVEVGDDNEELDG